MYRNSKKCQLMLLTVYDRSVNHLGVPSFIIACELQSLLYLTWQLMAGTSLFLC